MNRVTLSVCVIARNEERNIRRCLDSVRWADEIVVVDSGSTDRTGEIALEYTQKVYTHGFKDYADQKNYAASMAAGDWVLSLDADEEITDALRREIGLVLEKGAAADVFQIRRKSLIFGRWFRFSGTQSDQPIRLWKKGSAVFSNPIHEIVQVKGTVTALSNHIRHFTYPAVKDYMPRLNRYTSAEACFFNQKNNRVTGFFELKAKPLLMFFNMYFLRLGFLDGIEGFLFCFLSAYYVFSKHAKQWELAGVRPSHGE